MKRFITFLLISFFVVSSMWAQKVFPVRINGSWLPPYSSNLSDYASIKSQDLMFTVLLNDPVEANRDVRFNITIENNGREIMTTSPNFLPLPMTISQFTPELITGTDLAQYLQPQNLVGAGGRSSSNFLPEGFNRICLEVIDYHRGVPISNKTCVSGFFRSFEAPILSIPTCHKIIPSSPTQNLTFNWLPRHIGQPNAPTAVEYEFTLVELLPGIGDPNDGFDQAIQIYQTTTMVPSLLYMEGEPQLEANKIYAWRVQAKDMNGGNVFVNNGFSQVCTFSMQAQENHSLPDNCEVSRTNVDPINTTPYTGTLAVGEEVQLGFFDLTINELTETGSTYTGIGTIAIPFLKAKVLVAFTNLKINKKKEVYEVETAKASLHEYFDTNKKLVADLSDGQRPNDKLVTTTLQFLSQSDNIQHFISARQAERDAPIQLPLVLDKRNAFGQALPSIILLDLNFTPEEAFLTAIAPVAKPNQRGLYTLSGHKIGFTPQGINSKEGLALPEDVIINRPNGDKIQIVAANQASRLNFNCQGFKHFTLKGKYTFSTANLLPADRSNQEVVVDFTSTSDDLYQFIGELAAMPNFQLPKYPDYIFTARKGRLDYSEKENIVKETPANYDDAKTKAWKGFAFEAADLTLPDNWKVANVSDLPTLKGSNFIIGEDGVYADLAGSPIIPFDQGRIRDWPFSIENLSVPIAKSEFQKAKVDGQIKVPTLDEPFDYEGDVDQSTGKVSNIEMRPAGQKVGMSLWNASMVLNKDALIEAVGRNINGQEELIPYANVQGKFDLSFSEKAFKDYLTGNKTARIERLQRALGIQQAPSLKLNQLLIKGYQIDPLTSLKKRFQLLDYDKTQPEITIGEKTFPLTALDIVYEPKTKENREELGLVLTIAEGVNQVGIVIWARKESKGNFTLNRIEIDSKVIDCDCTYLEGPLRPDLKNWHHRPSGYAPSTIGASIGENLPIMDWLQPYLADKFPLANNQLTIPFLGQLDGNNQVSNPIKLAVTNQGGKYIAATKSIGGADVKNITNDKPTGKQLVSLNIDNFDLNQAFIDGLTSQKINNQPTTLPLDLTESLKAFLGKYNPSQYPFPKDARLLLVGFEAESSLTSATAKIMLVAPYADNNGTKKWMAFGNGDVKITPKSVGFQDLKLFLLKNYENTNPRFPFKFIKNLSNEAEGSYAYIKCEGFERYNVQGQHLFAFEQEKDKLGCDHVCGSCEVDKSKNGKTTLMEVEATKEIADQRKAWLNGTRPCKPIIYKQLTLPFTIKGRSLTSFSAPINTDNLNALVLKDFESILFHIEAGSIEYNTGQKPNWAKAAPQGKFDVSTFTGIHFKKLGIQPLGFHTGSIDVGTRKVLKLPATDFVYQPGEGLYGNLDMTEEQTGDLGGWKYKLQKVWLNLAANKVTTKFNKTMINEENIRSNGGLIFNGEILLPIVAEEWTETDAKGKATTQSGYMKFVGALGFDVTAQSPAAFFRIEEADQGKMFKVDLWNIYMQLGTNVYTTTTAVTLALNEDADDYWNASEFEPAALLNGQFIIAYEPTKPEASGYYQEDGFTPQMKLPKLAFSNFKINDPNLTNSCKAQQGDIMGIRNMHIDYFTLGGGGSTGSVNQGALQDLGNQTLGGLPVQIWDINFNCDTEPKSKRFGYKIDFEVHVDVLGLAKTVQGGVKRITQKKGVEKPIRQRSNALSASQRKQMEIFAKINNPNSKPNSGRGRSNQQKISQANKQTVGKDAKANASVASSELKVTGQIALWSKFENKKLTFWKAYPEAFMVDGQFSIFTVKGGFVMINGDPVYGNGYKGYVDIGFQSEAFKKGGLNIKAVAQAGKTTYDDSKGTINSDKEYTYFFFDTEVTLQKGFGIPNPPLADPQIYFHGGGLGFQWNMIVEDPSPGSTFSSRKKTKGVKTIGAVNHDSGILSADADPYGYLRPGKSLSGFNFRPRPDAFGAGLSATFSYHNSSALAWWDAAINISLNKNNFAPLKINGLANLYVLSEDGKISQPEAASGVGSLSVELNIEKKFISAHATVSLDYPNSSVPTGKILKSEQMEQFKEVSFVGDKQLFNVHAHGEATAYFLFGDAVDGVDLPISKAGQWQIKLGTPKEGIGMQFQFLGMTLAQMNMYMQAGYGLDPMPNITELVRNWGSGKAADPRSASQITSAQSGDGLIFGARFNVPDNTYEFLMFKARLDAAMGFDVSMVHYDDSFVKSLNCTNSGKFGLRNWYARGQAYGYVDGALDMHIKLGFIDKWVNLVTINAAALVQAELPNPTWMRAALKVKGSVLDGLLKVNIRFKMELGKRCDGLVGNPLASIPVIESTLPRNTATNVPIYQNPTVSFNFPIEKIVVLKDYDQGVDPVQRSFRPHLKSIKLYKSQGGQRTLVQEGFVIAKNKYSATLPLQHILDPNTDYDLEVEASWQEYKDGVWKDFIYNGSAYIETTNPNPIKFKTGPRPQAINEKMLEYQAPGYDQRYWHKDYALPQLLFAQEGYDYLFPKDTDKLKIELQKDQQKVEGIPSGIPLEYYIQLTEFNKTTGAAINTVEFPLGIYPGKSKSIERPVVSYKSTSQYANLNYRLPFVETKKVSGKVVEFRKLRDQILKKGYFYQIEVLRRPIKGALEAQTEQTSVLAYDKATANTQITRGDKGAQGPAKTTANTQVTSGQLDFDDFGGTITRNVTQLKATGTTAAQAAMNKILYKYTFGVSTYDHLYQKLEAMKVDKVSEKDAAPKAKYDHPKSRVQAFPTLPLGKKYKDRYFTFSGGKEGFDEFDQVKLLTNLIVNTPRIPSNTLSEGAHPWEKDLYIDRNENVPAYIDVNRSKKKNTAFEITDLKAENILNQDRIDQINARKSWRTFDKTGLHTNYGPSSYKHHKHPPTTENVQFAQFRDRLATKSWECNRAYGETWSAQDQLGEAGWKEFMKEIMAPYYQVADWAFHLRFNSDEYQKKLSLKEKKDKVIKNKVPNGKIDGILGFQPGLHPHFAFEDSRERILKNQFLLAKSVATNMVFISYLSFRDRCKTYDLFNDIAYWFNRRTVAEKTGIADYKGKFIELGYPQINKWNRFDQVASPLQRQTAGEKKWQIPVGEINQIKTIVDRPGNKEYALEQTINSSEWKIIYPDFLGVDLVKIAVYEAQSNRLIYYWDEKLDEDHHYEHRGADIIPIIDYTPPAKQSGVPVFKGRGRYEVIAQVRESGSSRQIYTAMITGGKAAKIELKPVSGSERTQKVEQLKDYPLLRISYLGEQKKWSIQQLYFEGYRQPNVISLRDVIFYDPRTRKKLAQYNGSKLYRINDITPIEFDNRYIYGNVSRDGTPQELPIQNGTPFEIYLRFKQNGKNFSMKSQAITEFIKNNRITFLVKNNGTMVDNCLFTAPPGSRNLALKFDGSPNNYIQSQVKWGTSKDNHFSFGTYFQADQLSTTATVLDGPLSVIIGKSGIQINPGNINITTEIKEGINSNYRYHLTGTYDGQKLIILLNNKEVYAQGINLSLDKSKPFQIGKQFKGQMDYINFWTKAFDACNLPIDSHQPNGSEADLLFHYSFNNDLKEKIRDLSSKKNDGTLYANSFECNLSEGPITYTLDLCNAACSGQVVTRPTISHFGDFCAGKLNLLFPSNLGVVERFSIKDNTGKLLYSYNKSLKEIYEVDSYYGEQTVSTGDSPFVSGAIINELEELKMGQYQFAVQLDNAYYEGLLNLQNKKQSFPLNRTYSVPNSLMPNFPILQLDYNQQNKTIKLVNLGSVAPKDAIVTLLEKKHFYDIDRTALFSGESRAVFTNFDASGFTVHLRQGGCNNLDGKGKRFAWGQAVPYSYDFGNVFLGKNKESDITYGDVQEGKNPNSLRFSFNNASAVWGTVGEELFKKGTTITPTSQNMALDLASNSSIRIFSDGQEFDLGDNFTFSAKIWLRSLQANTELLNMGPLSLLLDSEGIKLLNRSNEIINTRQGLELESWYHIALVRNGSKLTLYLDGKDLGSAPITSDNISGITPASGLFFSGGDPLRSSRSNYIDGYLDFICMRKQSLKPAQIALEVTKEPLPGAENYFLFYHFNQAPSIDIVDDVTNCRVGDLYVPNKDDLSNKWVPTSVIKNAAKQVVKKDLAVSNYALEFDGNNDFIKVGNIDLNGKETLTMEAWIKVNELNNLPVDIAGIEVKDNNRETYYISQKKHNFALLRIAKINGTARLQFGIGTSSSNDYYSANWLSSQKTLEKGKWYYVTGVFEDRRLKLFINGVQDKAAKFSINNKPSNSITDKHIMASGEFFIGKGESGNYFKGVIDHVKVWHTARTEAQIADDMQDRVVRDGNLILSYDFNEGEGTVSKSKDFQQRIGQLSNMPANAWVPANWKPMKAPSTKENLSKKVNYALDFDGKDDVVEIGNLENFSGDRLTIQAWIKPEKFGNVFGFYMKHNFIGISINESSVYNSYTRERIKKKVIEFRVQNSSSLLRVKSFDGPTLELGKWIHVAGVFYIDKDYKPKLDLYLNGELIASEKKSYSFFRAEWNSDSKFKIGNNPFFFKGQIDNVKVWKTARNQAQIRADMLEEQITNPNLMYYYDFNDGSGNSLTNKGSAKNANGTLENMTNSDWVVSAFNDYQPIKATLSGPSEITAGKQASLTLDITSGTSPFTVTYKAGNLSRTINDYVKGTPITINPAISTKYTLVSVKDAKGTAAEEIKGEVNVQIRRTQVTLINEGSGDGAIRFFLPPHYGTINKLAIYDKVGNLTLYYDKVGGTQLIRTSPLGIFNYDYHLATHEIKKEKVIEGDFNQGNYEFYVQVDNDYFQTKADIKKELQVIEMTTLTNQPSQLNFPFPAMSMTYDVQSGKVKIQKEGIKSLPNGLEVAAVNWNPANQSFDFQAVTFSEFSANSITVEAKKCEGYKSMKNQNWNQNIDITTLNKEYQKLSNPLLVAKSTDGKYYISRSEATTITSGNDANAKKQFIALQEAWKLKDSKLLSQAEAFFQGHNQIITKDNYAFNFAGKYAITGSLPNVSALNSKNTTIAFRMNLDKVELPQTIFAVDGMPKFSIKVIKGKIRATYNEAEVTSERKIQAGKWYHVAVIDNGQDLNLFIDGKKVGTKEKTNNDLMKITYFIGGTPTTRVPIGDKTIYPGTTNGQLDYIYFIQKALTEAEIISQINNAPAFNAYDYLFYYHFNQTPSSTIMDNEYNCVPAKPFNSGNGMNSVLSEAELQSAWVQTNNSATTTGTSNTSSTASGANISVSSNNPNNSNVPPTVEFRKLGQSQEVCFGSPIWVQANIKGGTPPYRLVIDDDISEPIVIENYQNRTPIKFHVNGTAKVKIKEATDAKGQLVKSLSSPIDIKMIPREGPRNIQWFSQPIGGGEHLLRLIIDGQKKPAEITYSINDREQRPVIIPNEIISAKEDRQSKIFKLLKVKALDGCIVEPNMIIRIPN
ncbi:MAG: LamG-like jellyroll fold domain-containing protein [Bacteroidota bacterium]